MNSFSNVIFITTRTNDFVDNVCFLMYWNAIRGWTKLRLFFVSWQVMKRTFSFKHFCTFSKQFLFMLSLIASRYGKVIYILFLPSISFTNFFGDVFNHFMMELGLKQKKGTILGHKHFFLVNLKPKLFSWQINFLCSVVKRFNSLSFMALGQFPLGNALPLPWTTTPWTIVPHIVLT